MKAIRNPFIMSGYVSPDYFCDRTEETRALVSALRNGRNVTLMSPRRMGKTGLIHNAFFSIQQADSDAVCIYIDIFPTKDLHGFVSLLAKSIIGKVSSVTQTFRDSIGTFFRTLRPVLTSDPITGSLSASIDFKPQESRSTLDEIFSYLKSAGRECFIAIDEFQQISEYADGEDIEALLRSYIQFCPNVHFIFSGSKQHLMSEIFDSPKRPFYRSTQKMSLHAIDEEAYCQFATEWMAKVGMALPQEVFHEIYTMFEGHTWYVHNILNRLYERAERQIGIELVYDCIREILASEHDDFSRLVNMLTLNQAQLLKAIAKDAPVSAINASAFITANHLKGTSSINKALAFLLDNEYVYRSDQGYIVYDRFLGLWLRQL